MHQLPEVTVTEMGVREPAEGLLSTRLKEATNELHHEVEHGSEVNRRIVTKVRVDDDDADKQRTEYRDAYIHFLKAAYGFEHAVLREVKNFMMQNDLETYGYFPELVDSSVLAREDFEILTDQQEQLRAPTDFPEIRTLADLAGVEYVRRGSRNGNAYIAHAVRGNIGVGAENGAAYLNLDQGQTRPNWEKFKTWLDSLALNEQEQAQAVNTALETFRAVGRWHATVCR
ncbi:MAG: biliverdin-producing heme oxygenase [bacterium]|nr:biliverdin-producing heme oxygenase [bacterium]